MNATNKNNVNIDLGIFNGKIVPIELFEGKPKVYVLCSTDGSEVVFGEIEYLLLKEYFLSRG